MNDCDAHKLRTVYCCCFIIRRNISSMVNKLVFDLDGTLYSLEATGVGRTIISHIINFFMEELHLDREEATRLSEDYYHRYGVAARGIKLHHPDLDFEAFMERIHRIEEGVVHPDPLLRLMLERLIAEGWQLWVYTNGCGAHAERILRWQGIWDLFGPSRVWDIRAQFNASGDAAHCKPIREAYETFCSVSGGRTEGDRVVMIEDSMKNLVAPREMGWETVWVSEGRELPPDAVEGVKVIAAIHDLEAALAVNTAAATA